MSKADISSFSPLLDKVSPVQLTCFKIMSSNHSRDSDCQFLICPANSLEKFRHLSLFHDRDNGRVFPRSGLICQFKLSPELKVNWRSIARKFSHPFARSKLNSWAFSCNNDTLGQPCRIICQSFEENFENANLLQYKIRVTWQRKTRWSGYVKVSAPGLHFLDNTEAVIVCENFVLPRLE